MSNIQQFLRSFKPVYQPTSPLLKTAVTVAIALCTVTLVVLRFSQWDKEQELALLTQQAAVLQQENAELSQRISILGTKESYRQLAAELLGLVDPETIVFESE